MSQADRPSRRGSRPVSRPRRNWFAQRAPPELLARSRSLRERGIGLWVTSTRQPRMPSMRLANCTPSTERCAGSSSASSATELEATQSAMNSFDAPSGSSAHQRRPTRRQSPGKPVAPGRRDLQTFAVGRACHDRCAPSRTTLRRDVRCARLIRGMHPTRPAPTRQPRRRTPTGCLTSV